LHELSRGSQRLSLEPDPAVRERIAKLLGLEALDAFTAEVQVRPWLDGAAIRADFRARVTQLCGVSLEPFVSEINTGFEVKCLPAGSANAPSEEAEITVEAEADDPPDLLDGEVIDLGAYLVEHLSLEIDPFPRKPGAAFETFETGAKISPFAALAGLKPTGDPH
jgi:uncharacterized metal-binding protein YceD (DUF177 family)